MGFFSRLLILLMLLAIAAQGAALYWGYERYREIQVRIGALESQVQTQDERLRHQAQALKQMEEGSVNAMVKRANDVIVEGWDAIVDSVESELIRARKALKELDEPETTQSSESTQ